MNCPQATIITVTAWSWKPSSWCTLVDTARGLGSGNPEADTRGADTPSA